METKDTYMANSEGEQAAKRAGQLSDGVEQCDPPRHFRWLIPKSHVVEDRWVEASLR